MMNDRELQDKIENIIKSPIKPWSEMEKELTEICNKQGMLQTALIIKELISAIGTKQEELTNCIKENENKVKQNNQLHIEAGRLQDENTKLTHMLILEQLKNNKYFEVIQQQKELIAKYELGINKNETKT